VDSIVETIADWTSRTPCTLVAIDAPLGWPAALGQALASHEAGAPLWPEANLLFRRETDKAVRLLTGKTPLDVGADRIARTARTALVLMEELRGLTAESIPLAWSQPLEPGIRAIEVYPGATLAAYGIQAPGYKKKSGRESRLALLDFLREHMSVPDDTSLVERNDDALDAALCVLAGVDFLRGKAAAPLDLTLAKKEGWIWVRRPVGPNE
jgi:predicted RNase H-like nuclease